MADTLLLDPNTWDLTLDAGGNIALASGKYPRDPAKSAAYGLAQDVACQCRLFLGELYYDTTQGVPYWQQLLGYIPNVSLINAKFIEAAFQVQGVQAAKFFNISVLDRKVVAQLQVTDVAGNTAVLGFVQ